LFDRNPLSSSLDRSSADVLGSKKEWAKPGTIATADPLVLPRKGAGGCRFSRRQMSRVSPPTMRLPIANGSIRTPGRENSDQQTKIHLATEMKYVNHFDNERK
ncbi:unnamed protein product, partial [Musa hybrid cultivar]